MKSTKTLHKLPSLLLLLLLLLVSVWSHPMPDVAVPGSEAQQSLILIQNNLRPEHAKNYEISVPKAPQPGEPCLTISWKTNPDGTGPDEPQIYLVNGYFKILTPSEAANLQQ
ncbi:uncharacterized protein LOC6583314 [Drosophila mojavensis]|uniref:Uncharacterized protein n=1 Tax=Drosophila mojavensis TaxID=7230 RepID=B4KVI9_DROMO|nr:uncharacterized protein LOC6583314 [Drosophila mojavensis]EDW19460.1 uncharacterized protein Dmoj_GI13793 [Drosophila mojavensis]